MAYAWRMEHDRKQYPGLDVRNEFVFARHFASWILPLELAPYVIAKSNPNHLPVVINDVYFAPDRVEMWERTGTKYDINRQVFATEKPNEDHYLRLAIDRINDGYSVRSPTVLPSSPSFVRTQEGGSKAAEVDKLR